MRHALQAEQGAGVDVSSEVSVTVMKILDWKGLRSQL